MKIDFFLISTMEIFHFAPVLEALNRMGHDARFVSPQLEETTMAYGWDNAKDIDRMLEEGHYPFEKHCRVWADVVVTTQSTKVLYEYSRLKVRMMYGTGLIPPTVPHMDYGRFDHYLVHGPFSEKIQFWHHSLGSPPLRHDRVHIIGYPKFDSYFERRSDVSEHWDTKAILWLPSWQDRSSIERFLPAISELRDDYVVVARPHHGTTRDEPDRMSSLKQSGVRLSNNTKDFFQVYDDTNIILADVSSGAFTEAMLTGKPVLGLGDPEGLLADVPDYLLCPKPEQLWEKVAIAQCAPKPLVDYFFTTTRGHDGEVAAKVIAGL